MGLLFDILFKGEHENEMIIIPILNFIKKISVNCVATFLYMRDIAVTFQYYMFLITISSFMTLIAVFIFVLNLILFLFVFGTLTIWRVQRRKKSKSIKSDYRAADQLFLSRNLGKHYRGILVRFIANMSYNRQTIGVSPYKVETSSSKFGTTF